VPAVKSLLVRARLGLVEAGEARDTACAEIRADIAFAHGRGVRASGRSRKHLRDCSGCREYRRALRGQRGRFLALGGGGPLATIAKLLGIGGASSGAAAGAGAGGSAAVIGGATAATATKVAVVFCCAAVVGGGAVEVRQHVTAVQPSHHSSAVGHARAASVGAKAAPAGAPVRVVPLTAPARRASDPLGGRDTPVTAEHTRVVHNGAAATGADIHREAALSTSDATTTPAPEEIQTGGAMAPDEDAMPDPSATGGNGALNTPDDPIAPADPAATVTAPSATSQPAMPVGSAGTTPTPGGPAGGTPVTG